MNQPVAPSFVGAQEPVIYNSSQGTTIRREVSESCFEYLLAEILSVYGSSSADNGVDKNKSMSNIGYDVGYR